MEYKTSVLRPHAHIRTIRVIVTSNYEKSNFSTRMRIYYGNKRSISNATSVLAITSVSNVRLLSYINCECY